MLLYNYGHLDLGGFVRRWWPLFFILWGALKLYERTAGRRYGSRGAGRVTGNEAGLVLAAVAVVAIVVLTERHREWPNSHRRWRHL